MFHENIQCIRELADNRSLSRGVRYLKHTHNIDAKYPEHILS